jgi:hypothetical protein
MSKLAWNDIFDWLEDGDIGAKAADLAERDLHPQEVLDLSEFIHGLNVQRHALGRELVVLPPKLHLQLNAFAKRGMRKGGGRKKKGWSKKNLGIRFILGLTLENALDRKRQLYEQSRSNAAQSRRAKAPINKVQAESQAAEEARDDLLQYGIDLAVDTIKDLMNRPSKFEFFR